jgi:hypothetical protein
MSAQLPPGNYFIELAFRRPVSEDVLARALSSLGFRNIEFDKNEDPTIGAIRRVAIPSSPTLGTTAVTAVVSPLAVATKAPLITAVVSTVGTADRAAVQAHATKGQGIANQFVEVKAARDRNPSLSYKFGFDVATGLTQGMSLPGPGQDAVRVLASKIDTSPATVEGFNAGQTLQHNITKGVVKVTAIPKVPLATAAVSSTASNYASLSTVPGAKTAVVPPVTVPIASTPVPGTGNTPGPAYQYHTDPATQNADGSSLLGTPNNFATRERVPDPIAEQEEAEYRRQVAEAEARAAQSVPQGTYEAPPPPVPAGMGPEEGVRLAPPLSEAKANPAAGLLKKLSEDMSQSMLVAVPDRWKRWVEWGSPFATSAAYLTNVSGEEESTITRFRFVATLTKTVKPQNLPDMSWVFIRRLAMDPFKDLSFQLTPYQLQRGAFYEFRFFSRQKSNPSKESVKETLAKMGFSPMKLNLLKKNMRIPRRGNVSVNMWLGYGKWSAPNSVVTTEDPFFFESVKEVSP